MLLLIGFFLVPEVSQAGIGDTLVADFFAFGFRITAFLLNFIGGVLFVLSGFLVNLMLGLNLTVLDDSNALVHIGWRIVRDIANLGFVLFIIVIAFATILRREQYGVKALLPKLIAAAILVNFSFAIAGVFINFSHVLTNVFAERVTSGGGALGLDLSSSLSSAFGPQRFLIESDDPIPPNPEEEVGGLTGGIGTAVLISITGLIFTVVFTLIAAFVLLAFAFMLLLRYLYLTFLIIVSPIVWLFWVIPNLAGQFTKWWSKFMEWVFFAPAVMFFTYLALVSVEELGKLGKEQGGIRGGEFFSGSLQNIMVQGAQMITLAGILIGGLWIATQMSIKGSAGAMGIASRAGKGTRAWAGRKALQTGTYPLRGVTGRKLTAGLQGVGANLGQTGGLGRRVFGRAGRFLTAPLRQVGRGLSEARLAGEALTAQARKEVRGRSIEENARRFTTASNPEKVEIVASLSLHARSDNAQVRQAAIEALSSIPQDALTKEVRLSFLYGRGGETGTPYGPRIPFREPGIMRETYPETRSDAGLGAQVEEMIAEEARRQAQAGGGTGGGGTP